MSLAATGRALRREPSPAAGQSHGERGPVQRQREGDLETLAPDVHPVLEDEIRPGLENLLDQDHAPVAAARDFADQLPPVIYEIEVNLDRALCSQDGRGPFPEKRLSVWGRDGGILSDERGGPQENREAKRR